MKMTHTIDPSAAFGEQHTFRVIDGEKCTIKTHNANLPRRFGFTDFDAEWERELPPDAQSVLNAAFRAEVSEAAEAIRRLNPNNPKYERDLDQLK